MSQSVKITLSLVITILLIGAAVWLAQQNTNTTPDTEARLTTPKLLTTFQLTAHDLKPLNIERLKGKWTLLFFGYTHCPDICPTTLTELTQVARQLQPAILNNTQFVFVSVDPQRDSPESLAEYVGYFNESFLGATGSIDALTAFARQLDSRFSLETDFAGEPVVNHSSAMLLIDPQVRYYARLKAPHYAEEILTQYLALRNSYSPTTPQVTR
ncbi:MAG: SCO family protein [Gammaproteobacteria bacterium]|nr:SCO family protein [Gammaproteobacteria bacterium]